MQALNFVGALVVLMILTYNEPKAEASCSEYNILRENYFRKKVSKSLGFDLFLNPSELEANEIIMALKTNETQQFKPSQHIFDMLDEIKQSDLFKYISHMPKGAVLHGHDIGLCSTDFLIELTKRDNLWMCWNETLQNVMDFRFSKSKPTEPKNNCNWFLKLQAREKYEDNWMDGRLHLQFSMGPKDKFKDNNAGWQWLMSMSTPLEGLLSFEPVLRDYYYRALKEFHYDGVQYLEFRSTLPILYDLEGTNFTQLDTVRIYQETLKEFMKNHTDFIGSKLIYAPLRNVTNDTFKQHIELCLEIKKNYPDFFAGFDLGGQEENGRPLKDFAEELLKISHKINFYFNAGETNWFGTSSDENLIDAVLMGTKRIGNGFAALKHSSVLEHLKTKNIPVEVNPISNQVLQLVSDFRNHPCSHFFAGNYPVVISSDYPSFWKSTPLSHDFYIAFLGIASAQSDLKLLKKLALNSIRYSSMDNIQKAKAMKKWQVKWNAFISKLVTENPSYCTDDFITEVVTEIPSFCTDDFITEVVTENPSFCTAHQHNQLTSAPAVRFIL